jgi:5,10-methylenetetrahydrofolate reductase
MIIKLTKQDYKQISLLLSFNPEKLNERFDNLEREISKLKNKLDAFEDYFKELSSTRWKKLKKLMKI